MSAINVTIHGTGMGADALTGKEQADGLTVSFENEPPAFLSWKSFRQLLSLKSAQAKPELKPGMLQPAQGANL